MRWDHPLSVQRSPARALERAPERLDPSDRQEARRPPASLSRRSALRGPVPRGFEAASRRRRANLAPTFRRSVLGVKECQRPAWASRVPCPAVETTWLVLGRNSFASAERIALKLRATRSPAQGS